MVINALLLTTLVDEYASYQAKRDRLDEKREDRKEHRTEVNKVWVTVAYLTS